jgi:hypothetical protein
VKESSIVSGIGRTISAPDSTLIFDAIQTHAGPSIAATRVIHCST